MIQKKPGRPTRAEASERALANLDVLATDPNVILRKIAADASAPASARVAAARSLLIQTPKIEGERSRPSMNDTVSKRAIRFLQAERDSDENEVIPACAFYRGISLHDQQTPQRLLSVKRDVDFVYDTENWIELVNLVRTARFAPEARLFAEAKLEIILQIAVERREARPHFDVLYLRACVAGLGVQKWRDSIFYTSILDTFEDPVPREEQLFVL